MKNDKNIQRAIEQYCIIKGCSPKVLGEKINTPDTTVIRWKNGDTEEIRNSNWIKLFPLIKPYLPPERIQKSIIGGEYYLDDEAYAEHIKMTGYMSQSQSGPTLLTQNSKLVDIFTEGLNVIQKAPTKKIGEGVIEWMKTKVATLEDNPKE